MPRNSSGTYTLPAGNPVVANTLIQVDWANPTMSDIGQALTESLDRFGRGGMLAQLKLADGTVSLPAFAFNSEASTGLYHVGAGTLYAAVLGVERFRLTTSGGTMTGDGTVTGNLSVGGNASVTGNATITGTITATGGWAGNLAVPGNLSVTGTSTLTGAVGIGGAPGSLKLNITGAATTSGLAIQNGGTSLAFLGNLASFSGFGTDNTVTLATYNSLPFTVLTAGLERFRIDGPTGQVGINSPSPAYTLDVRATEPFASLRKPAANSNFYGYNIMAATDILSAWLLNANTGEVRLSAGYAGFGGFFNWSTNGTDKMRLTSAGSLLVGTTTALEQITVGANIASVASNAYIYANHLGAAVSRAGIMLDSPNATFNILTNNVIRVAVDGVGTLLYGGIEVGYRGIPRVTGGFERGKMFAISSGQTIGSSNAGDIYSLYNDSAAAVTLTQGGGVTLRLAGTTSTGNRTLAARGIATIWFNGANEPIISGPGVS